MRTIRKVRGFTLIEILIVVIILGILASIVVAQFANVRGSTSGVALKDNLRWMRSAILLYQTEHGSYPDLANFQGQMTQFTDQAGNVVATKDATHKYGSYMYSLPGLPVGAQQGQSAVTGPTFATGYGWQYDETTGQIHANTENTELDSDGVAYNTY
jgi:general secretion pathway protein G